MSQPKPSPATHFRMPSLGKPAAVMREKPAKSAVMRGKPAKPAAVMRGKPAKPTRQVSPVITGWRTSSHNNSDIRRR